jgi:hypothetical protein
LKDNTFKIKLIEINADVKTTLTFCDLLS